MALYDSENNRLLDTNDNVLLARSTFTIGTQEAKKIYVGENEVKAIYIGDNLVYEKAVELPQLSAPTIALSEDILLILPVENAESYSIYDDEEEINYQNGNNVVLSNSYEPEQTGIILEV